MTNLLTVVPELDAQTFSHLIPSLEKNGITTADLLTIDAVDIATRARVPVVEVRRLIVALLQHLKSTPWLASSDRHDTISLLDDGLDDALNGGIQTGFVVELAGESAVGKTQYLLTLLLSVQLPAPLGPDKNALYISTEAKLSTKRLAQILYFHPRLKDQDVSLDRVHSTHIRDLEAQEHVLRYQVPVIIERHNIGLVVVDSIAANYRAELDKSNDRRAAESVAQRSLQIGRIGAHLRALARSSNVAIVLANQVADRFDDSVPAFLSQSTQRPRLQTPPPAHTTETNTVAHLGEERTSCSATEAGNVEINRDSSVTTTLPSSDFPLDLDHQQRFFTGWGDDLSLTALKNPSLGLTWTSQIATRIVLFKTSIYDTITPLANAEPAPESDRPGKDRAHGRSPVSEITSSSWNRTMKVVFSAWTKPSQASFEIWRGGVRTTDPVQSSSPSD